MDPASGKQENTNSIPNGPTVSNDGFASSTIGTNHKQDPNNPFLEGPKLWWKGQEDVVISGVSVRMPQSDNMQEFADNLMNGVDMVTEDSSRWPPGIYGLQRRHAKVKNYQKLDADFFNITPKQANVMDPQQRMLLEVAYETILDSGYTPQSLRPFKVGCFVGCCMSELVTPGTHDPETLIGYSMTGTNTALFSNRVSYMFDFQGPSFTVNTACSSSLLALQLALDAIRKGECDAALVAGTNITMLLATAMQYHRLNVLSPQGKCQSFDVKGDGYARAEGIGAIFLQKTSAARRNYCTVVHAKSCTDGYKSEGITSPSGKRQSQLMDEIYREAGVSPKRVKYVECHGTGTHLGDTEETTAITDIFCRDRADSLLIGAVKSNMGHAEPASGVASLAKVIIAMETGIIPPNLHYNEPNPSIPGLFDGRLRVVDKKTPLPPGLIAVNSFGVGGSSTHALLKPYNNEMSKEATPGVGYLRMVCFSGRTQESIETVMKCVESHPGDSYLHALLAEHANFPTNQCPYRGYTVLDHENGRVLLHEITKLPTTEKRPIWFIFSGFGSQWVGMGRELMCLDLFRQTIQRCSDVILPYGLDTMDMIMNGNEDVCKNPLHFIVCMCAIQIAFTEILKLIGVESDGIIGHSTGEMVSSYADGCITLEQTMLISYHRGRVIIDSKLPPGAMAAVGLSREEVTKRLPAGVCVACNNAADSVTVSGDEMAVLQFVDDLKKENIFVKLVNSAGIASHSHHILMAAAAALKALKPVITKPKLRSSQWLSTCFPEDQWGTDLAKYCSAEYFVNNMTAPVYFHEALKKVPPNAIVIEIAPHTILNPILRRSLPSTCSIFGLMKNGHKNNVEFFFQNLGKIHGAGATMRVEKLYPQVQFPVPRGTPMISPLIRWDHTRDWATNDVNEAGFGGSAGKPVSIGFHFDPYSPDSKDEFLLDHVVDGRVLFPFSGYVVLAWRAAAKLRCQDYVDTRVVLEDVNVLHAHLLTKPTKFVVSVSSVNGDFEIVEGDTLCATGRVTILEKHNGQPFLYEHLAEEQLLRNEFDLESEAIELQEKDVYKVLQLRGYEYGPHFRSIRRMLNTGNRATIAWRENWVTFLDALLQAAVVAERTDLLKLPVRVQYLRIEPVTHLTKVDKRGNDELVHTLFDHATKGFLAGGVEIREAVFQSVQRHSHTSEKPTLERVYFCPLTNDKCFSEIPQTRSELHEYNEACRSYAVRVLKHLTESCSVLPNLGLLREAASSATAPVAPNSFQKFLDDPKCTLVRLLHKLLNLQPNADLTDTGNSVHGKLSSLIKENLKGLEQDKLWGAMWTDFPLKPFLDVIMEAQAGSRIRAAAIEPASVTVPKLIRDMQCTHPLLEPEWLLVAADVDELVEMEEHSMSAFQYDVDADVVKSNFAEKYKNHDFAVLDRVLHRKADVGQYLERVKVFLKDDAFLIVNEVTGCFEAALAILALRGDIPTPHLNGSRMYNVFYDHDSWVHVFNKAGYRLVGYQSDNIMNTLYLLRKAPKKPHNRAFFDVDDVQDFSWLKPLQGAVEKRLDGHFEDAIWLTSTKVLDNGTLGLGLCLQNELRNVGGVHSLLDASVKDSGKHLDLKSPAVQAILDCNLHSNVHKDGVWGTYQHIVVKESEMTVYKETEHAFINTLVRGDLSTLQWIESPNANWKHLPTTKPTDSLCQIYYAALNFKDVMHATGRLQPEATPGDFAERECLLGMEFSGRLSSNGRRVMGLIPSMGLATTAVVRANNVWDVPDHWSLEEAATVPMVYMTCYYALVARGRLKRGDKVLIHSGSGGVGLAAIGIALDAGAEVYTTVGSDEKKKFVQARFPHLKDHCFSNSRTTEFELHILRQTNGRGVDVILNSLAEDKLQASVRCLARDGRFLEIGKFDLARNSPLGMSVLLKGATIHGIGLEPFLEEGGNTAEWQATKKLFADGVARGVVKPLPTRVFSGEQPEEAFRHMAQGKHMGKVILQLRREESEKVLLPKPVKIRAISRAICHPEHSYLVTGGLGGFGLELTQWLINRGARKVVLTSRSGVRTGYQARRLLHWQRLGVKVVVSNLNVAHEEETSQLIEACHELGPLGGVFHLAMVLRDALFENQTVEAFKEVAEAKYWGLKNLDKATRKYCGEELKWFVAWSSISCGRGNAGQTNYGWANSCMERIIEKRRADNFPGTAIRWGAIGDVGAVAESMGDTTIVGGTLPQRIQSCLRTLDTFLLWSHPIVSSFVRAEVNALKTKSRNKDPLAAIAHIFGAPDIDQLDANSKFIELGLDSFMGIEIKQALERDLDTILSLKDIRMMTVNKLKEIVKIGGGQQAAAATNEAK